MVFFDLVTLPTAIRDRLRAAPIVPADTLKTYASRQAAIGGWPSVPSFARGLGIVWTRLVTGEELATASAAFGEPEAVVAFDSGRSDASSVALRGEVLSRRQWSGTKPLRFCPACLRDDVRAGPRRAPTAWHRTWWDVAAIDTCAVHRMRLARACACGGAVPRTAPFDGRCPSCRTFLGDADGELVPDGETLAGTRYVLERLGAGGRIDCAMLDQYPLRDAIAAAVAVGASLGARVAARAVDVGFSAFERWPRGFDAALDTVAAGADTRAGRWGAGKAYGPLHAWIAGRMDEPLAKRMARRMAAHADRNGVSPGRTVGGRLCGGGSTVTLAELSTMTGLSHAKASRLARANPGTDIRGSGVPAAVDAAAAKALAKSLAGSVGLAEIAAMLGIGRKAVRSLVAAGLLVPIHDDGAGTRRAFRPEAAAALVERAIGSLLPATDHVVPLVVACRDMQVTLTRTLGAVLAGRVRGAALPTGTGLAALAIVPADLRQPGRPVTAGRLTLADVARRLGVKWEVARALVGSGLVARDLSGAVAERSVAAFHKTYVAASEAAAVLDTSPRAFAARAAEAGIEPAIGHPACRQTFFERAAVERLITEFRP